MDDFKEILGSFMPLIISFFLALILCVIIDRCVKPKDGEEIKIEHTTDTIVKERVDTFFQAYPIASGIVFKHDTVTVLKTAKDTAKKEEVVIPITQKYYHKDSLYDAWISGYAQNLDSISVYPKHTFTTINNTTTITKMKYTPKLYVIGGLNAHHGTFYPNVGISLATKKKWLVGAKIGLYEKEPIYSVEIGYNILQK